MGGISFDLEPAMSAYMFLSQLLVKIFHHIQILNT